jgi:hypothetical protein
MLLDEGGDLQEQGGSAGFRRFPLQRHRHDLATLCQHLTAQPGILELVGGLWLPAANLDHPLLRARVF